MTAVVRRPSARSRFALAALASLLAWSQANVLTAAEKEPAASDVAPSNPAQSPAPAPGTPVAPASKDSPPPAKATTDPKPSGPSGAIAGLAADLGQGLRYVRVASLADDLEKITATLGQLPVVLDLRRAETNAAATGKFVAALRAIAARNQGAVFLLIGADTPAALRGVIPSAPRLVTLGIESEGVSPRVGIAVDPAADRAAYDAILAGASLSELIVEKVDKQRYDEARLARDHASGTVNPRGGDATPEADEEVETDNAGVPIRRRGARDGAKPAAAKSDAPVRDHVLQRAVFLHRALLALNKLPAGA